ncbi:MAG: hypothetical protein AABW46_02030 [Nanoarchaeota archaeon]
MLSEKEILKIAKNSLKKFNLKAEIKFLPFKEFLSKAKKSPIIAQTLKEGSSFKELNIPALISHKEKEHIYLSSYILNRLLHDEPISIQKKFIKALLYHEIYHILYKNKIKKINFKNALNQEDLVTLKFREEYPALESIGRRISKKYINF